MDQYLLPFPSRVKGCLSWLALGLVTIGVASALPSQPLTLPEVMQGVQAQYETTADVSADFIQTIRVATFPKEQRAEGKLFFKKPALMRWEYRSPEKQLVIGDGKTVWLYYPQDQVVQTKDMSEVLQSNLAVVFLKGLGSLEQSFHVALAQAPAEDRYRLLLTPKTPDPLVARIVLEIQAKTFQVVRSSFEDAAGNLNTFQLKNVQINKGLASTLFRFTKPPGVRVEGEEPQPLTKPKAK